jgi:hypothetical protein
MASATSRNQGPSNDLVLGSLRLQKLIWEQHRSELLGSVRASSDGQSDPPLTNEGFHAEQAAKVERTKLSWLTSQQSRT